MFSKRTLRKISVGINVVLIVSFMQVVFIKTEVKAQEVKVKNVIYLIADGMNDGVLTASRYYKDMQDGKLDNTSLTMETIRTGYVKTNWTNGPITDSAPAASALSSGYKTNSGVIGLTTDNIPKATILEAAELNGLSTGIVATSEIMHATPAGFTAHVNSRGNYNAIMLHLRIK